MYGHSPIGDLILYMDNCLICGIHKFIETIGLKVKYIYKKHELYCMRRHSPIYSMFVLAAYSESVSKSLEMY
jgi:hypothetical protein